MALQDDIRTRFPELIQDNPKLVGKNGLMGKDKSGNIALYLNRKATRQIAYPCINFNFIEAFHEEKLPAKRGTLFVNFHTLSESKEPFKTLQRMNIEVTSMINRTPQVFNIIDDDAEKIILRCVRCVKIYDADGYEEDNEIQSLWTRYDMVMSENEEYGNKFGEDPGWP